MYYTESVLLISLKPEIDFSFVYKFAKKETGRK